MRVFFTLVWCNFAHNLLIFPLAHGDEKLEVGFWRISAKWDRNQKQFVLYQSTVAVLYFSYILACVHSSYLCINTVSKLDAYFSGLH